MENSLGKHVDFPLKTFRLLIATVVYLPKHTGSLLKDAMDGLAQNDQWIIENSRQVDKAKEHAYHEMTDYLEKMDKAGKERDRETIEKLHKETSDLKNENRYLRRAFETLNKGD